MPALGPEQPPHAGPGARSAYRPHAHRIPAPRPAPPPRPPLPRVQGAPRPRPARTVGLLLCERVEAVVLQALGQVALGAEEPQGPELEALASGGRGQAASPALGGLRWAQRVSGAPAGRPRPGLRVTPVPGTTKPPGLRSRKERLSDGGRRSAVAGGSGWAGRDSRSSGQRVLEGAVLFLPLCRKCPHHRGPLHSPVHRPHLKGGWPDIPGLRWRSAGRHCTLDLPAEQGRPYPMATFAQAEPQTQAQTAHPPVPEGRTHTFQDSSTSVNQQCTPTPTLRLPAVLALNGSCRHNTWPLIPTLRTTQSS